MFYLLEDQLIDDIVSRAEQSRISYNLQREEFHNLNGNLQTYLNNIKTIDDDNHHLKENIQQIRTNYISTLENDLKYLLNDFHQLSQKLTEIHIDRYKFKAHTRRIVNEREEFKQRINFIASNEKEQIKHLNILQKKERSVRNEFLKLNEQLQNCLNNVENEKQAHQQAMNKVDSLQVQLEQICIERSKTEFQIQTLKEEIKLIQTAKDFLNEEHETIIATEIEANEYLLSHLNDSIVYIREDFNQLNKTQLKQIENEYKQMLQISEENFTNHQKINELTISQQRTSQIECERLQEEYQLVLQDLTTINNHNQILSEQILAMETDLYSLRDQRIQQLTSKDNEIECSKIELQILKEKLNHLVEYDQNLKFELTLYRGVLESEYKRKQKQSSINTSYLRRPTILQTNNNLIIDRTTSLTSSTNQSKFNDQQEENPTNRDRIQSEYDTLGEDKNNQINDVLSTKTSSNDGKLVTQDISWQHVIEPFNQEQEQDRIKDQLISSFEAQQIFSASSETRKSPTPSIPPVVIREDQSAFSPIQQLTATPSELRSLPIIPSTNQQTSPTETVSDLFKIRHSSLTSPQEPQTLSEIQKSPTLPTTSTLQEDQTASENVSHSPSALSEDHRTISEVSQSLSSISSDAWTKLSDIQGSPSSPTKTITTEYQQLASDLHEQSSIIPEDRETASEIQIFPSVDTPTTSTDIQENIASILSNNDNKLELKQDDISEQTQREEEISSSLTSQTQENYTTDYFSSTIISSDHNDDKIDERNSLLPRDGSKQSSSNTSLSNIEEVDLPTSQKVEITSEHDNDPNLAVIIQDLRYVFHELANDEDLVEINYDLPDKLLDRLEFRDQLIRTLFDSLLRKYLLQSAAQDNRPKTLDWIEFRDILFPIITGRYTERHIRKLFDIFDTSKDGYLSLQEIAELLEILQANNTISLAQNIIDEYDTDHDGKLSVDELIEAIKKTDDINEHVLSKETENKQWFNQTSLDSQAISLEISSRNFPTKTNDKFNKEISLLGRIFKNVGTNPDSKQLDSNKKNLSIEIINEFINNNINISYDDLQLFIELYLNKKQNTNSFINWIEFRDIFLPIINNGYYSTDDVQRWFDIFDIDHNGIITQQQVIQFLRLLQIENPDEIMNKLNIITETHTYDNIPWTLDELIFALNNVDETCAHVMTNNEQIQQIASFDIDWLSNNVF
ncbi:unnamed protein product [Rotaria sordida]|uniref:EF-hand domain-containing protein n=1 Tax=Rotaria sordida TaxID=392033 RepID=A0A819L0C5_9BILA|nr:unnamed protein product [Rotaria sordida]CAF3957398.1 unnamed protein product [Rotaria sordida]